jgi:GGDEF domain-containing protein
VENRDPGQHRRVEDLVLFANGSPAASKTADDLPTVALGWMAEMIRGEFDSAIPFDGQAARFNLDSAADAGVWRREWKRRWRRLQLPDQLTAYAEELDQARTAQSVYTALTRHAVSIIGGHACLLFLRDQESGAIQPAPNPRLKIDSNRLRLRTSPHHAGLIDAHVASPGRDSPFTALAPLFTEEGAVCLAHAPFGDGGTLVMVERRHERVWEAEDWYLLRAVSIQAEAALERVRLYSRVHVLSLADSATGMPSGPQLDAVLEHAWCSVLRGEALSVVAVALDSRDRAKLRTVAEVVRQEARGQGVAVRDGEANFLVVLPQVDRFAAAALSERIRGRLMPSMAVRIGMAHYEPGMESAQALVVAARNGHDADLPVFDFD